MITYLRMARNASMFFPQQYDHNFFSVLFLYWRYVDKHIEWQRSNFLLVYFWHATDISNHCFHVHLVVLNPPFYNTIPMSNVSMFLLYYCRQSLVIGVIPLFDHCNPYWASCSRKPRLHYHVCLYYCLISQPWQSLKYYSLAVGICFCKTSFHRPMVSLATVLYWHPLFSSVKAITSDYVVLRKQVLP